ncbi:MAG: LON peptidase substrate-binding domain-containing protein, partial [Magnetococcus sp. XQGC-1]
MAQVIHHNKSHESMDSEALKPYTLAVISDLKEILKYDSLYQEQVKMFLSRHNFGEPDRLADFVASMTSSKREELQEILETLDIRERLEKSFGAPEKRVGDGQGPGQNLQAGGRGDIGKPKAVFFLREQLKEIQKELGITKDDRTADVEQFRDRLKNLHLGEEAATKIDEEL